MRNGRVGTGYVMLRREGARWRADVYLSRPGRQPRHVAEIIGSLACVERIARAAPALVSAANGDELLVEFLRANRLRIIGPRLARGLADSRQDPADVGVQATRDADEFDRGSLLQP